MLVCSLSLLQVGRDVKTLSEEQNQARAALADETIAAAKLREEEEKEAWKKLHKMKKDAVGRDVKTLTDEQNQARAALAGQGVVAAKESSSGLSARERRVKTLSDEQKQKAARTELKKHAVLARALSPETVDEGNESSGLSASDEEETHLVVVKKGKGRFSRVLGR